MARPQEPYQTSWGEVIPGLYRCSDGRWWFNAMKKKFTEPDERRAVARFRAEVQPATVDVPKAYREQNLETPPGVKHIDRSPA